MRFLDPVVSGPADHNIETPGDWFTYYADMPAEVLKRYKWYFNKKVIELPSTMEAEDYLAQMHDADRVSRHAVPWCSSSVVKDHAVCSFFVAKKNVCALTDPTSIKNHAEQQPGTSVWITSVAARALYDTADSRDSRGRTKYTIIDDAWIIMDSVYCTSGVEFKYDPKHAQKLRKIRARVKKKKEEQKQSGEPVKRTKPLKLPGCVYAELYCAMYQDMVNTKFLDGVVPHSNGCDYSSAMHYGDDVVMASVLKIERVIKKIAPKCKYPATLPYLERLYEDTFRFKQQLEGNADKLRKLSARILRKVKKKGKKHGKN